MIDNRHPTRSAAGGTSARPMLHLFESTMILAVRRTRPSIQDMKPHHLSAAEQRRRHYLGPSLDGEDVVIDGFGFLYGMPHCLIERPQGDDGWLLMLFHDSAMVAADDGLLLRPAGSLVLWAPHQPHVYGHRSASWRHSWLHARGPRVERLARWSPVNRVLQLEDEAGVTKRFASASDQLVDDPDPELCGLAVASLFRSIERQQRLDQTPPLPAWLNDARSLIDQDYHLPLSLDDIARRVGRSPSHLSASFRQTFGLSPKGYLVRRRLESAAWMLRRSDLSIERVAAACGYGDIPHFTRQFRRHFGTSPGRYR